MYVPQFGLCASSASYKVCNLSGILQARYAVSREDAVDYSDERPPMIHLMNPPTTGAHGVSLNAPTGRSI
jgi:hypothetical protein